MLGEERPLPGVRVELYEFSHLLVYTYTNPSGQYQFAGLAKSSDYALLFKDEGGQFATAYYSPHGPSDRLWPLSVYSPTVLNNVPIHLQTGGAITGTVQLKTGVPLSNALVSFYRYDEQIGNYYQSSLLQTHTDGSGNYAVTQINPGIYRAQFGSNTQNPLGLYAYEFYGAQNRRNDVRDAKDIFVWSRQITGGINHTFGADHLLFLPLLSR